MQLDAPLKAVLEASFNDATGRGQRLVLAENFMHALVESESGANLLDKCGVNVADLKDFLAKFFVDYKAGVYDTKSEPGYWDYNQAPEKMWLLSHADVSEFLSENLTHLQPEHKSGFAGRTPETSDWYKEHGAKVLEIAKETLELLRQCAVKAGRADSDRSLPLGDSLEQALLMATFYRAIAQKETVSAGDVLANLLLEHGQSVEFFEKSGIKRIDVLTCISHNMKKADLDKILAAQPPAEKKNFLGMSRKYKIYLHNDDYTSMEYVVSILQSVFRKNEKQSNEIMANVHFKGKALVGEFSHEEAHEKARKVMNEARAWRSPLLCTVE